MIASSKSSSEPLVEVNDLTVTFNLGGAVLTPVDGVSLSLGEGEIVGLVGESGSGKSTLAMAILRLLPRPGRITSGRVKFDGRDLLTVSRRELRLMRGRDMSLVVQDALAALNPVTTVDEQISEVVRDHEGGRHAAIRERVVELLGALNIRRPRTVLNRHAHELSGGMQQRVVMAGALILRPRLLIADEPTTALDVTVQAQILDLLRSIRQKSRTAILFVSHDLATVAEVCDRVMVMYAGQIVETGPISQVFRTPTHPYTKALIGAIPSLGSAPVSRLKELGGSPPDPGRWPAGCRFHPRCPLRQKLGRPKVCEAEAPVRHDYDGHWATCHFADESRMERSAISETSA